MVNTFEELIAWQKARILTREIYKTTPQGGFSRDFGLRDQIRRAAVSAMSNIAEGFERGTAAEFHHFLTIAKSSCAEVRSQLYVALDVDYQAQRPFDDLMKAADELGRVLAGLRTSVGRRRS